MFTEHLCALDSPNPNWLGKVSLTKTNIKETGLWMFETLENPYD